MVSMWCPVAVIGATYVFAGNRLDNIVGGCAEELGDDGKLVDVCNVDQSGDPLPSSVRIATTHGPFLGRVACPRASRRKCSPCSKCPLRVGLAWLAPKGSHCLCYTPATSYFCQVNMISGAR
jgi:hypothetical protein